MTWINPVLYYIVCCLLFRTWAFDDVISNCGGFVKPSREIAQTLESDQRMNVSEVKLHLVTKEGQTKYITDCAPNGYYIIPVYDKGSYNIDISGPRGWVFNPSRHSIQIASTEHCNNNFELIAFEVSGQVISTSCSSTQDGVTVTLLRNSIETIHSTVTKNGQYHFTSIPPGTYVVRASHPHWSFSKNEVELQVVRDNVIVKEDFVVSGYHIEGLVTGSTEGDGMSGVLFLLYSEERSSFNCTRFDADLSKLESQEKLVCSTISNEEGNFGIYNVPCGRYQLVPHYANDITTFDVRPKQVDVLVSKDSVVLLEPFLIKGFSVRGRLINTNGEGVSGVVISLSDNLSNSKEVLTGSDGYYRLDEVTSGTYHVKASKLHHGFLNLKGLKITPNVVELPDIVVTHYDVCGTVSIPQPPVGVSLVGRTITLKSNGQIKGRAKTDKHGSYCVSMKSGKYLVVPEVLPEEVDAGLLLTHSVAEVEVKLAPLLDINFDQARLTVSGLVRCINTPCDSSISVSLASIGRSSRTTTGLAIAHDDSSSDYFVFKNVLPGKYEVTINHDNWCWDKERQVVEVTAKDHTDTAFSQRGYLVVLFSSHTITLNCTDPLGNSKEVELNSGKNQYCVPHPGKYKYVPVAESCYRFTSTDFTFDTATPEVNRIEIERYKVRGVIKATDVPANEVVQVVVTNVLSKESSVVNSTPIEVQDTTKESTHEYILWAKLGDELIVQPQSPSLLFYPRSLTVKIDKNECPSSLSEIKARPGLYLNGSVIPPVSGVSITVTKIKTNEVVKTIETDESGEYSAGPLYDNFEYHVSAFHPQYFIKRSKGSQLVFTLLKLGSVTVVIVDEEGSPIGSVLVSLTSSDGYINNNATNQSGVKEYVNLFPGDYYLRPLLKEYIFNPTSLSIGLKEGEQRVEIFSAHRVAFSCFGHVQTLNGHSIKDISVEAVGSNNAYEEAKTDSSGNYRIRGLKPSSNYTIHVKLGRKDGGGDEGDGESLVERAEPESLGVMVENKDLENINFIVFLKDDRFELMGSVVTSRKEYLGSLTVHLKNRLDEVVDQYFLGPGNFFIFTGLNGTDEYTVYLTTKLTTNDYKFELPSKKMKPINGEVVVLTFEPTIRLMEEKMDNGPFFTLLFLCTVGVSIYYNKSISMYIKGLRTKSEKVPTDWNYRYPNSVTSTKKSRKGK
eukprot:TRINITY_DN10947_c0_g1_i1.p1 TRINITY_DN10947_c0_g1~~TRINITY_DN10947_c0_g1_i1.p1  ORF type:complete len:1179 (+),score=219.89 TRINITY_DN10947_c0_g1_i1:119-3655(+)